MAVEKYKLGTSATLLSTELNSLANNTNAVGSAFNNVQGGGGSDGYVRALVELVASYGTAPGANTGCALYFLKSLDGTNFEDGASGVTPAGLPAQTFQLRPVTGAQRIIREVPLPPGIWKPLLRNDGTGVGMAASGNVLSILPATHESVA